MWLVLFIWITTVAACPDNCICPATSNQVSCDGGQFEDIPRGLPPSISTLDLSNNDLMTLSSTSLVSLRSVINFKLKNNDIVQIHDGAFQPMQSLQTLDLSGNALTELNQHSLQGPSSLMHLDLSKNNLQSIEGAFAKMSELSRLELSDNRLTRITEFTFRDLSSLRYLLLSGNQISQVDKKAFRKLEKLMYLVLKGNPIGDVPRYQFNSLFLSYVDMSECGLTKIPRGLPNSIRYLQLRRNNMTTIHRHSFQDCSYISILVLDENGLSSIQERAFEHMTYLQQLWLNNNLLRAIPKPLPSSLQRILMDSNLLDNVTNVFPKNSQLNTLSFMGNTISHLSHDALSELQQLKSLDLSNNQLEHIYGHSFNNNSQLRTLQLSKNPLQYFHSRAFYGLTNLRTLSLAYVHTQVSMYWDIFQDIGKITQLDLDSSPYVIQAIMHSDELLSGLSSVEDLSMQSSDINSLRSDFPEKFPNLLVLHLSSARWHCDTQLLWLRIWLLSTEVQIDNKEDIRCFTPRDLHNKAFIHIDDSEFAVATPGSVTLPPTSQLTTFTTDPQRATTPPARVPQEEEGEDSYEDESESKTFDLEDIYEDLGTREDRFPFIPGLDKKTLPPPTSKELSWEEILSRSSDVPTEGPPYAMQNDNLSLQTKPASDFLGPVPTPSASTTDQAGSPMMLIIIVTSVLTVVIAAVLIATIVYFSRKGNNGCTSGRGSTKSGSPSKRSSNGSGMYQNGIKYKHRQDVLYFMPGEDSTTDSLQTNASTKDANMALYRPYRVNSIETADFSIQCIPQTTFQRIDLMHRHKFSDEG
ncbi:hypothetical protein CAPTEDRAFT_224319 [Capitella teleta]|uniref:LRRCT domain-containing protein n=1 Tax=Capitella teleta TaxID=283909 RepID=R7VC45_CAPTE|nr:hypothetical protein CAPTEDRAFT_224319 [Capitella teleta]|eukprot:ELU13891.1 hypothetical protein CAPTEDRAFT_224319 [Capitella teleta]